MVVAALCFSASAAAQAGPGQATPLAAIDQSSTAANVSSQSPSSSSGSGGASLSPASHPDATSVGIPTASQIEAEGEREAVGDEDPVTVATAVAKPAAITTAAKSSSHPSTLAPKYDVALIGQRDIGNGLDFYSRQREIALGQQLAQQVESSARLVTDPVIIEYVNRIGQNLVRHSDAKVPFTIKVLDTEEVNAFALPGGFFFVNSGLILAADNEAELAGVMAHEIAHVCARHATKNLTRSEIWNVVSVPLIFAGGPAAYMVYEAASLAVPLSFLKFSRDAEREADLLGLEYDYSASYDPEAFVEFFEKLNVEKKKPNLIAKAFATHPMNADRIEAAQQEIRKYLPDRPDYILDTSEFESVKARLQSLENGERIGGARENGPGPVLIRRTSNEDGTQDSSQSADNGRPTLKRKPSSSQ
jgi:hypothetical protein